jgi:pimeloyl-ACP methyl ester carboxylesterase
MSTFVLIHGAGDVGWYWHLVEAELRRRGHDVVAPDLPNEDETAGLPEYADTVVEAVGDRRDLVVVGQSFGGFTAPLVADRLGADLLVFVAGMVPRPGESPDEWWQASGFMDAVSGRERSDDPYVTFLHDVPADVAGEAMRRGRGQSGGPMAAPWPLPKLPDVPIRFVLCTQDRFFPPDFMRAMVADRLGIVPDEIAAGHCVALSRPKELTDILAADVG